MKRRLMALMALTILTACDSSDRADLRKERADDLYRSAMNDYRAGRLDAAADGFEKAIRKDPANASARFQLACLLQDSKRDYQKAYCGYREYLLQHPESDKAKLAEDRLAICEKELAKALAAKYGLMGSEGFAKELEFVRRNLKAAENRAAIAEKELESLRARQTALTAERDRLVSIVKGGSAIDEGRTAERPRIDDVKALLEEDEPTDRIKASEDVAALRREEAEEVSAGSSILPAQAPDDKAKRDAAKAEKEKPKDAAPEHPETYVVQEGDTLYGIAKRFYGRLSAWKLIRNANQAVIPMDNRLKAGDTIRLP